MLSSEVAYAVGISRTIILNSMNDIIVFPNLKKPKFWPCIEFLRNACLTHFQAAQSKTTKKEALCDP